MKKAMTAAGVLAALAVWAGAEFASPTAQQVKDAAKDPTKVAALLKDANDDQIVSVLADVLAAAAELKLDERQFVARVRAPVAQAMEGRSDASRNAVAQLLGETPAGKPGLGSTSEAGESKEGEPPVAPRYAGQ